MFSGAGASDDESSSSGKPDLVLLTGRCPFGGHEPYLDAELAVLAERFGRIILLPAATDSGIRPLPDNVSFVELDWFHPWPRASKIRALASKASAAVLFATLRHPRNWRPYLSSWRMYLDLLAMNVLKYRVLRRFVESSGLEDAVFYAYWFETNTLALALLRRAGVVTTAISRAHNFDIYDDEWDGNPVPFREFKAREMDMVFPISEHGANYLRQRVSILEDRTPVARLGVESHGVGEGRPSEIPLIVSCAWLEARKRIHLIPEILARMGTPLRWIHFGEGDDRARVEAAAAALPDDVQWEVRGRVSNRDLLDFYRRHHVDLLISLSISEGIPVSMMEAQSFGIPIVATAVAGVPEIVNESTGILLDRDASLDEVAGATLTALEPGRFGRDRIVEFSRQRFDARKNHSEFADRLIALKRR